MAHTEELHDVELVSVLVVSGVYCIACIARKASIPVDRVTAAFCRMEKDWREPLIDTAECMSCRALTTVYSLRVP
jgi:hypothetical protein